MTPFHEIPRRRFVVRMVGPSIVLFIFFFLLVGVIAGSPEFHTLEGPATVIPFWETSFTHYNSVFNDLFHIPQVCWLGTTVNEFQDRQCEQFWGDLLKSGGLALLPFLAVGVFLLMGLDALSGTYKRGQKKIIKGEGAIAGTITNPPDAPRDFYSWFYCFKPLMVELNGKEQIRVYLAPSASTPAPGTKMVVFNLGQTFGERRHIAMVYTPHVAVVGGE